MVERRITGDPTSEITTESITVETPEDELTIENVEMTDDGGAIINPIEAPAEDRFDANLAEFIDEEELQAMSSDIMQDFKDDKSSRDEWYDAYSKGLKLLGFTYEDRSQPFQGASGVTHPLLAETVTQFQAQAYKELLPANGPVRTQIIGNSNTQKEEQALAQQEDPRNSETWGAKAFIKEGQSILSGGLQDTASSIATFPERTVDALSGEMQEQREATGTYKPDWTPFDSYDNPIETKTWWGKQLNRSVIR